MDEKKEALVRAVFVNGLAYHIHDRDLGQFITIMMRAAKLEETFNRSKKTGNFVYKSSDSLIDIEIRGVALELTEEQEKQNPDIIQ